MTTILADKALLPTGWASNVRVTIDPTGRISEVSESASPPADGQRVPVLIPAPGNHHSHTFQRAMAGLSEHRGSKGQDSFWTWREVMYRFLGILEPEDLQAIAAFAFMEMAEHGYAAVAEFHYVHHAPGGLHYETLSETSQRMVDGAIDAGLGLTLLPVLYQQGGMNGVPLQGSQHRFSNQLDVYLKLMAEVDNRTGDAPEDFTWGVAPHSLRAVPEEELRQLAQAFPNRPFHIHVAEQPAEVEEVLHKTGRRPVEWLLEQCSVGPRWCLIHATHLSDKEVEDLASTGAVAGFCPVTEANLGDGIARAAEFVAQGGRFGVGTDSNVSVALAEELRQLEYSQRLREGARAVLATSEQSTGRHLVDHACSGGALALNRESGEIAPGKWADLIGLDLERGGLFDLKGDAILDGWVFSAGQAAVDTVWSAGRQIVADGRHVNRQGIAARYSNTLRRLMKQW